MWSMDTAKEVLEKANKILEDRREIGLYDEVLSETAKYLEFALTTIEWQNKAAEEEARTKDRKEREVDGIDEV